MLIDIGAASLHEVPMSIIGTFEIAPTATAAALPSDRSLLIVDDDKSFLQRLARAMEIRGFAVSTAESVVAGLLLVEKAVPAFAVVDMRLGDGNGLDVISAIKKTPARGACNHSHWIWEHHDRSKRGQARRSRLPRQAS
jgi:CheY-like chemotaxis protein